MNPIDSNRALIAMEFGGLWQTFGGGNAWFRVHSLPAVFVSDVEYGPDGRTVVAAVQRDNGAINGGGIYVSRTSGDSWSRPSTSTPSFSRMSANSVSHAPDERGQWYVGTSFGVAISRDDGATWTHAPFAEGVQSVLAMPRGTVLAMTRLAVHRSDDYGMTWRIVIQDDFGWESFTDPPRGGNKMDRSPFAPWAFIFKDYRSTSHPAGGGGTLIFYELDTGQVTRLPTPQGRSRGPFVRVSKDRVFGGRHITVWIGHGWDGYYVTREDAASIRAIRADSEWNDWVSFFNQPHAGIHSDTGDLGVDGDLQPVLMGTDGGIFKPRPGAPGKWMSAAVPGSGMNSLLIEDLAGTNTATANGERTSLYIGTQDNAIWASPDNGQTWPGGDPHEGWVLEVRPYAGAGEPITVAYNREGTSAGVPQRMFANANLTNQRAVSNLNEGGQALDGHTAADGSRLDRLEPPFFIYQQAGTNKESSWIRLRWRRGVAGREAYVSFNSGKNWRKVADINLDPQGEIRVAGGLFAWLPVSSGSRIGLMPLSPIHAYVANTVETYDSSDIVLLPGAGSLGQRCGSGCPTVFGVHPLDWKFLIAPDIVANNVKISRDGGRTWSVDVALTKQVLRGGELVLWDGDRHHMEVTAIEFEPPPRSYQRYLNRIFVGTRDAGVICSDDGAQTWRTVKNSDQVKYITGFHFRSDGGVFVSSYGHGLWYIKPASRCPAAYSFPWDMRPPVSDTGSVVSTGAIAAAPPKPRGIPDTRSPKLFLTGSAASAGVAMVSRDSFLEILGRDFPAGQHVTITLRETDYLNETVRVDAQGRFALTIRLPEQLHFGMFTVDVAGGEKARPVSASFKKALTEEEPNRREEPASAQR